MLSGTGPADLTERPGMLYKIPYLSLSVSVSLFSLSHPLSPFPLCASGFPSLSLCPFLCLCLSSSLSLSLSLFLCPSLVLTHFLFFSFYVSLSITIFFFLSPSLSRSLFLSLSSLPSLLSSFLFSAKFKIDLSLCLALRISFLSFLYLHYLLLQCSLASNASELKESLFTYILI